MSNLQRMLHKGSVGPPMKLSPEEEFKPISWSEYFDEKVQIKITDGKETFNVYKKGTEGPVLLLVHGGGYSGLTWALFTKLMSARAKFQIVAPDLRGHGETITDDDDDLSAERLCRDLSNLVNEMYNPRDLPPIVVVGHSMGGAIAVHLVDGKYIASTCGLVVIDVVEGTAMAALPGMIRLLKARPLGFDSMEKAIQWSVRTGQIRNIESARVSVPGQICLSADAGREIVVNTNAPPLGDCIIEEEEESDGQFRSPYPKEPAHIPRPLTAVPKYTWRTDLTKSEEFWPGWFRGMSKKFLSCSAQKLLFIAGVDRLDIDLTVGQMQGKFQIGILPSAGHTVHEDVPDRVVQIMFDFLKRFRICDSD